MSDRAKRLWSYAILYLVWGSTYLAMRVAMQSLPMFTLAAVRFLVAGSVLVAIAKARKERWPARVHVRSAVVAAFFLIIGGNATVMWALHRGVPSGLAAVLVALTPIWLTIASRVPFTRRLTIGFALGLLGVGILVAPSLLHASTAELDAWGVAALLFASASWAVGSVIQRSVHGVSNSMITGLQMWCGAAMLTVLAAARSERIAWEHVTWLSVVAVAYLAIFGSLIAFSVYGWLLHNDEPARLSTYAYVNPVIAVFLGVWLLDEPLSSRAVVASAVVVAGVAVVVGFPPPRRRSTGA